jgi:hypothetical protein
MPLESRLKERRGKELRLRKRERAEVTKGRE